MAKTLIFVCSILVSLNVFLYACESDCIKCHPKLVGKNGAMDSNHKILTTCIKCHTKKSMEKVNMGITSCGEDCWKCHDIKKVSKINIKEHKSLNKCIKCHLSKDKNIFHFEKDNKFQNENLINIIE